jgi:hypothetical protein
MTTLPMPCRCNAGSTAMFCKWTAGWAWGRRGQGTAYRLEMAITRPASVDRAKVPCAGAVVQFVVHGDQVGPAVRRDRAPQRVGVLRGKFPDRPSHSRR